MENILEPPRKRAPGGGRPTTIGATVKTTILVDPARMDALNVLADRLQRSRNSLLREAIDDILSKHGKSNSDKPISGGKKAAA